MTKNEIKIGDIVRSKVAIFATPKGTSGEIVAILPNGRCKVRLGGGEDWYGFYHPSQLELIEPFGRRTAFLSELQALLRKYDAAISADAEGSYCGNDIEYVSVIFNLGDECMEYDMTDNDAVITADNIMDFNKE